MRIFLLFLLMVIISSGCDRAPLKQNIKEDNATRGYKGVVAIKHNSKELKIVQNAQMTLFNEGYYKGPVDGKVSMAFQRALKDFQQDNGLVPNGLLNTKTRLKLREF